MKTRLLLLLLIIPAAFASGFAVGHDSDYLSKFEQGRQIAGTQIARTISEKMPEGEPFYIAPLEIRFVPVSSHEARLEFKGESREIHARAVKDASAPMGGWLAAKH